jgi:hypothetical protein
MNKMLLNMGRIAVFVACTTAVAMLLDSPARAAGREPIDPAPTLQDYTALASLPDWSGTWTPDMTDQIKQEKSNPPPWKPDIAKRVRKMYADEEAGRPFPIIDHCFPPACRVGCSSRTTRSRCCSPQAG